MLASQKKGEFWKFAKHAQEQLVFTTEAAFLTFYYVRKSSLGKSRCIAWKCKHGQASKEFLDVKKMYFSEISSFHANGPSKRQGKKQDKYALRFLLAFLSTF